jgi:hypothetical protein
MESGQRTDVVDRSLLAGDQNRGSIWAEPYLARTALEVWK